jgi:hypothetical protein
MAANFQLVGLDPQPFEPLFSLSDQALKAQGALRYQATEAFSFPCRVSLEDADLGDELLLLPYAHLAEATPYRASGPIFVRRGAKQQRCPAGEVPPYVTRRLMSLRAYDAAHMMVDACVCEGPETAQQLQAFFAREEVAYVHLHNAKRGCFSCVALRA